jgi:hypothetical protein
LAKLVRFEEIPLNETRALNDRSTMTLRQVVVNHNLMAIAHQLLTNHTSNIAGTSGYKDAHANTPWMVNF